MYQNPAIGRSALRHAQHGLLGDHRNQLAILYPDGRVYGWHQYNDKTPERGVMD